VLSQNGQKQSVSGTVKDSDGTSATAIVTGINIDESAPRVRIAGPHGRTAYAATVPKARCVASDRISGIASCKLTMRKTATSTGYKVTIKATATTNAGVSKTIRVSFTIRHRRRR
jgi:adhesin/invasin